MANDPNTGVVVVALPASGDPIHEVGDEEKHATLVWLGQIDDVVDVDGISVDVAIVASEAAGGFDTSISGVGELGDEGAIVAFLEPDNVAPLRDALLSRHEIRDQHDSVEQYPGFTPHVTLGYEENTPTDIGDIESIQFDRLALWAGEERFEFALNAENAMTETITFQTATKKKPLPWEDDSKPFPWEGLILEFDVPAADGRVYRDDIEIRKMPLHLRWVERDVGEHDGAITVGRMLGAKRLPGRGVWAWGDVFAPADFTGHHADAIRSARNLIGAGVGQISADAMARQEFVNGQRVAHDGILLGATLVGLPAFGEARVAQAAAAGRMPVMFATAPMQIFDPAELTECSSCGCFGTSDCENVTFQMVGGSSDLPLASADREWDGPAASGRILDAATNAEGEISMREAMRGHFWHDGDGSNRGDYKLPFADVIDGRLTAVPRGLSAVLSRLDQTHGPSAEDKASIRRKVAAYQNRRSDNNTRAATTFTVTGDTELPIVERGSAPDKDWDGDDAVDAIFDWAGRGTDNGPDPEKLAQGFLYRNPDRNADAEWAWSIPFATVVGDELRIVPQGVFNASTIINGGRAPVDIPDDEKSRIRAKVGRMYERMGIVPPSERENPRVVERNQVCADCSDRVDTIMGQAVEELDRNLDERMGLTDGARR